MLHQVLYKVSPTFRDFDIDILVFSSNNISTPLLDVDYGFIILIDKLEIVFFSCV